MSDLERKIEKLIKDQILITESEAQDLATLIYNLPEIKGGRVGAVVKSDACGKWQKEKPNKPCLMVVKKCGLDNLEYQLFELQYYQGYLAVICDDGEEWGDYDSLQALEYFVIEYYDSKYSV